MNGEKIFDDPLYNITIENTDYKIHFAVRQYIDNVVAERDYYKMLSEGWTDPVKETPIVELNVDVFTTEGIKTAYYSNSNTWYFQNETNEHMVRFWKYKSKDILLLMQFQTMCEESLSPDIIDKWDDVRIMLCSNRQALKIVWEFVEWIEKANYECVVEGVDPLGCCYEGDGIFIADEIQEITDIKITDYDPD